MNAITYPKPLMTRTELIRMGIPKATIDRAIHCKYAEEFAEKSGAGRSSKWLFNTKEFEFYRSQGVFK